MKAYNIYDQSHERHFQYFAEQFAYKSFNLIECRIECGEVPDSFESLESIAINYHILMENCQSPIERIMGAILLFLSDGYSDLIFQEGIGEGECKIFSTYFTSQYDVLKYRADFLIRIYVKGEFIDIAIECDGHDFHERTKEQASKDKKRDRDFAKAGIIVLRFTGSDIFSRLDECADEIRSFICDKKDELMIKVGLMQPSKKKDK